MTRHKTRPVPVGSVVVGGDAPVSVQTMTKTDTRDVGATVAQIHELGMLGADIVRLAIPDEAAARAFGEIRKEVKVPLVADIHFDSRLALMALHGGADGIRINPGNLGGADKLREVVAAARERKAAIRVGVNSGSLEKDIAAKHGGATPEALVESAIRNVRMIEEAGYYAVKISVKASDVGRTVEAYRQLSRATDYPLHLGVTEAGTFTAGTVRSSVALGILLAEGIGDTIRVSLTDAPAREVRVGVELLRSLGLRPAGSHVISCPTCGRVQVDVASVAARVEAELEAYYRENPGAWRPVVAIMGCVVNGPGEAKEADVALVGGDRKFGLYVGGKPVRTVEESAAVAALIEVIRRGEKPRGPV